MLVGARGLAVLREVIRDRDHVREPRRLRRFESAGLMLADRNGEVCRQPQESITGASEARMPFVDNCLNAASLASCSILSLTRIRM
jgi:hypothetical protein